jgi:SAM-dependent methyltransferase
VNDFALYHGYVGEQPNTLITTVIDDVTSGRKAALDLGAGNLRDSKFLKHVGFERVVAVDQSEASIPYRNDGIELVIKPIQNYRPGVQTFDLIISCNTLFYVPKLQIEQLLSTMHKALRPGGVIVFNLLGDQDPWVSNPSTVVSGFSSHEAFELTRRFKVIRASEVAKYLPTRMGGQKLWHLIVMTLRRP